MVTSSLTKGKVNRQNGHVKNLVLEEWVRGSLIMGVKERGISSNDYWKKSNVQDFR